MTRSSLGRSVARATETVFRTIAIGLAVYGGLHLMRSALAQDGGTAYLPIAANAQEVESLQERVAALEDLLVHFNREGNDIYITGANVHVVNGEGASYTANGLGNVILGYNELRIGADEVNDRTGSHMLAVGRCNNYTSYGGIVVGEWNATDGAWSSVSGGRNNWTIGENSSVSGGVGNVAKGPAASIGGGWYNSAQGAHSSISGGRENATQGEFAAVSAGYANDANGAYAWVGGGFNNFAAGEKSSVSGGAVNEAIGESSAVTGGVGNAAIGPLSSVSGGEQNFARGEAAAVSGGYANLASGPRSSIGGGRERQVTGSYNWRAGELFQDY